MSTYSKCLLGLLFAIVIIPIVIHDDIHISQKALLLSNLHILFLATFVIGAIHRIGFFKQGLNNIGVNKGGMLKVLFTKMIFTVILLTLISGAAFFVIWHPKNVQSMGPYTNLTLYMTPVLLLLLYSMIRYVFGTVLVEHILDDLNGV